MSPYRSANVTEALQNVFFKSPGAVLALIIRLLLENSGIACYCYLNVLIVFLMLPT